MKGTIVTNPYDHSPVQARKVQRMLDEFARLGVDVDVISNDKFVAAVVDGNAECNVTSDFVLYFDKDKYTAQLLEKCGIPVFNSAAATAICDDKMLTHIVLSNHSIPMPLTLPGALCYNKDGKISDEYLQGAVDKLGLPMVVKQCYGSFGEQVYLCNTLDELRKVVERVKMSAYLFQHYEAESCGKDMRVIVVGGKAVCGIIRQSQNDFRSNVARGGVATAVKVPANARKLCEKAAEIIGLDFCGIDLLLGDEIKLCEVNSNAMFEAMEAATGVNVAGLYAEHIVKRVRQNER